MADEKLGKGIDAPQEGQAVQSTTKVVVDHDKYDDGDMNRPPESTNRPDVDIAHSVVAPERGGPTDQPDYVPLESEPITPPTDPDLVEKVPAPPKAK